MNVVSHAYQRPTKEPRVLRCPVLKLNSAMQGLCKVPAHNLQNLFVDGLPGEPPAHPAGWEKNITTSILAMSLVGHVLGTSQTVRPKSNHLPTTMGGWGPHPLQANHSSTLPKLPVESRKRLTLQCRADNVPSYRDTQKFPLQRNTNVGGSTRPRLPATRK